MPMFSTSLKVVILSSTRRESNKVLICSPETNIISRTRKRNFWEFWTLFQFQHFSIFQQINFLTCLDVLSLNSLSKIVQKTLRSGFGKLLEKYRRIWNLNLIVLAVMLFFVPDMLREGNRFSHYCNMITRDNVNIDFVILFMVPWSLYVEQWWGGHWRSRIDNNHIM